MSLKKTHILSTESTTENNFLGAISTLWSGAFKEHFEQRVSDVEKTRLTEHQLLKLQSKLFRTRVNSLRVRQLSGDKMVSLEDSVERLVSIESIVKGLPFDTINNIVINNLELYSEWRRLSRILSEELAMPIQLHCYISLSGSKPICKHFDPNDLIIFQITGEKEWRFFDDSTSLPLKHFVVEDSNEQGRTVAVKKGHSFYIPRGVRHKVVAIAGLSIHLGIELLPLKNIDVLDYALKASASDLRDIRSSFDSDCNPIEIFKNWLDSKGEQFVSEAAEYLRANLLQKAAYKFDWLEVREKAFQKVKQIQITKGFRLHELKIESENYSMPDSLLLALLYLEENDQIVPARIPGLSRPLAEKFFKFLVSKEVLSLG